MNYAKLPLEELEELVVQQEQHLRELTEELVNGRRAHQLMKSALIDKRQECGVAGNAYTPQLRRLLLAITLHHSRNRRAREGISGQARNNGPTQPRGGQV